MVPEAVVDVEFRQRDVDRHRNEATRGEGQRDRDRDSSDVGKEQQQQSIDDVADAGHVEDLTPLFRAPREDFGGQADVGPIELASGDVRQCGGGCGHGLAAGGLEQRETYREKPLGLVSFGRRREPLAFLTGYFLTEISPRAKVEPVSRHRRLSYLGTGQGPAGMPCPFRRFRHNFACARITDGLPMPRVI